MTLTDIANIALEDIGAKTINSIDADDVNARKIKRRLSFVVKSVAKKRNWVYLRRRIKLTLCEEDNCRYKYHTPNGLVNIISATGDWERQGKYIVSPDANLEIKCTVITLEPNDWGVNLQNAIIAELKKQMAFTLTGDANLANQAYQMAERTIREVSMLDALDEKNKKEASASWFNGF